MHDIIVQAPVRTRLLGVLTFVSQIYERIRECMILHSPKRAANRYFQSLSTRPAQHRSPDSTGHLYVIGTVTVYETGARAYYGMNVSELAG